PSSITSAPDSSSAVSSSAVRATSGWPAVMYGTSARRPVERSSANRRSIRSCAALPTSPTVSDEVVADADAIAIGILGFHDGPEEPAVGVAVGKVDDVTGELQIALRVADHADEWAREHVRQRIHRMHDAQLERVEHDERADGIDAAQIDERLDDDGV